VVARQQWPARVLRALFVGSGRRRQAGRALAVALPLACLAALVPAPHAWAQSAPGARPTVVAVWALADGDTPVAGGRVRVYAAGRSGRSVRPALRQRNGREQEQTYAAGDSLLEFAQLPPEFVVEVAGGRAGDRRFRGTFRALVTGYHSGDVVHVNPVTTLIADLAGAYRRQGRPLDLDRARSKVYRLLRIPDWVSKADLRYSDRYFDGDTYLRAARAAGGVAALDRALIREELRKGDRARRFRGGRRAEAQTAAVDWASLLAGDPKVLVQEAFKALGVLAAQKIGGLAAEKAGKAALGWVLAAFGYGDVLKDQDMLEIKRALDALGRQLTQLQGQVQLAGFSTLVHQTDRTIGQIDHATSQLALLANMPANDPTKAAFTQTIVSYIGANLLDAPSILNQNLSANIPLADNLIKSASRVVAQRARFFDAKSSAAVKSVYDYFAAYQTKLAVLLTEYFHAKPEVYSPANVTASLDAVRSNIEAQAASLKPAVPARTVVDTKTGLMWTQGSDFGPEVNLHAIAEIYKPRRGQQHFRLTSGAGPRSVPGVPFGNWKIPPIGAYEQLIDGWSGASPSAWLQDQARFTKKLLDTAGGQMWTRDGFKNVPGTWNRLDINVYDLAKGRTWPRPSSIWFFVDGWRSDFDDARAGAMFYRERGADELYWWGS
jgi:hypothetical protein